MEPDLEMGTGRKAKPWFIWLAGLPVVYFLSPLSLLALPALKNLPRPAWWLLGFYALSQTLPALIGPQPLLALGLALLRTLLMLGAIAVGAQLRETRRLWPIVLGLFLTYLIAGIYTLTAGPSLARLSHPYMTAVSLGLAGACGVWSALFMPGRPSLRWFLGLVSVAVLLLSGSRGPLLAALVGSLVALITVRRQLLVPFLLVSALVVGGGVLVGGQQGISSLQRLIQVDASGRDLIWADTLSVIRAYPASGIGSYLLGEELTPPGEKCVLWSGQVGQAGGVCPEWMTTLGHPWRVAHNAAMQQLAETGPLGLLGLFSVLTVILALALASRDGLSIAFVSGLLVSTLTDNTLIVPSPFFAELFWVMAGVLLTKQPSGSVNLLPPAALAVMTLAFPLWLLALPQRPLPKASLSLLLAPQKAVEELYTTYAQFNIMPGRYRAALRSCDKTCVTLKVVPFAVTSQDNPLLKLEAQLLPVRSQRLELFLYPEKATADLRPLASTSWNVTYAAGFWQLNADKLPSRD